MDGTRETHSCSNHFDKSYSHNYRKASAPRRNLGIGSRRITTAFKKTIFSWSSIFAFLAAAGLSVASYGDSNLPGFLSPLLLFAFAGTIGSSNGSNTNKRIDTSGSSQSTDRTSNFPAKQNDAPILSPIVDWSLFASLAMPGENATYSLHNGHGDFLEVTQGCEQIWGSAQNQIKSKNLFDFVAEKDALRNWLFNVNRERGETLFQISIPRENGTAIQINLKSIPIFVGEDPDQSRVVLKSIALPQDETPLDCPTSFTLSSIHRKSGEFISCNACWSDYLGYDLEELEGRRLHELVIDEDKSALEDFFEQAQSDSSSKAIIRIQTKSRTTKSVLLSGKPDRSSQMVIIDAKNMTVGRGNPAMDLLKLSVELIKESVLLLTKVGDGYRIRYVNKAFEEMTGYNFSRVSGCSLSCLIGPKTNAQASIALEEAMSKQGEHSSELLLYRKNGDEFWGKTYLCPLRDESGTANHYVAILEDNTEAKEVANELEEKNKELNETLEHLKETQRTIIQQENLRALGQMASGIAHDFNNLLAPILGFAELLLNIPTNARQEDKLVAYLKKIQVAAQDGAAVVGRLREFYRSQNNTEEFIDINPEDLVWQVKELTRHRWKNQAEGKGLSLKLLTDFSSDRFIMGNEPELRQVLTNLVINAVDAFEEDGTITIRVKDSEGFVEIQIEDTGSGMTDEVRNKCLEPFYTTKGKLGTGLGLSIVYGVIQRHHGEFDIKSKLGTGTCITMRLPAIEATEIVSENYANEISSQALRIMLVDDEEVLLEVISELLASGGHNVDNFSDPVDAIQAFEERTYDLVITDRAMPKMSGDQLAEKIKTLKPDTPVFMVTGFGDLIKETGEMPENVDEVLGKPVPLDVLNRKLSELLSSR